MRVLLADDNPNDRALVGPRLIRGEELSEAQAVDLLVTIHRAALAGAADTYEMEFRARNFEFHLEPLRAARQALHG